MLATLVNAGTILVCGLLGLFFGRKIKERFTETIFKAMALCVMTIGVSCALQTKNIIHVLVCFVLGTVIGEGLKIESRIDSLGEELRKRFSKKEDGRFTDAFLTSSLLFCVGSMAILGSLKAGIDGDYSIIFSKSLMDGVASIGIAATMGPGMLFSAAMVLIYQGAITLLSSVAAPFLSESVVLEMSAIGGVMLIGMALNMLELGKRIRLANMLPALLLPALYFPALDMLSSLFS